MNTTARIMSAAVVASGVLATAACGSDTGSASPVAPAEAGINVRAVIPAGTPQFTVTSPDLSANGVFAPDSFAGVFGCTAADHAPRVRWSGAPAAAQSFAVTMFDPDAPTGSGIWHWMNWDIPSGATEFTEGGPGVAGINDVGTTGYMGPCPPVGDKVHNYRITVLALDVPNMELPASTTPEVASFSMGSHIIGAGLLTATAQRP